MSKFPCTKIALVAVGLFFVGMGWGALWSWITDSIFWATLGTFSPILLAPLAIDLIALAKATGDPQ